MVSKFASDRIITAVRPRHRGFIAWTPEPETMAILQQVVAIIEEARGDGTLPLTDQQIFYAMAGKYKFPKSLRARKRLGEYLQKAKRAGLLSFDDSRDDRATKTQAPGFDSADEIEDNIEWCMTEGINKQQWQPVQQLVICEASGMVPQLEKVARAYGVVVWSSSGFNGVGIKHELAVHAASLGKRLIIHHLGDYDPSGLHAYQSLAEDVEAFSERHGGSVTFKRVCLTPVQIEKHKLPMAPTKTTDARAFDGKGSVQLEALPAKVIATSLRASLEKYFDHDADDQGQDESDRIVAAMVAKYGVV